jgi:serine/threonine-protein phosphatase 6 regulatory ankyrin repeat subunit B
MLEIRDEIGASPLYYAAWEGHLDIVNTLIAMGAEVTVATTDGLTGLHWAALEGHLEVCRVLLDNGADVDARTKVQENTPLLEVWNGAGHPEVAQLLIERGADVDAIEKWYGMSILHYAANKGLPTLVRTLIDNGASETLKDNGGRIAAHHASNSATRAAFMPVITR